MTRPRAATLAVLACLTLLPAGAAVAQNAADGTPWYERDCRTSIYGKWWPFGSRGSFFGWVDLQPDRLTIEDLGAYPLVRQTTDKGGVYFEMKELLHPRGHAAPFGKYIVPLKPMPGRFAYRCTMSINFCNTLEEVDFTLHAPRGEYLHNNHTYCDKVIYYPYYPED